MTIEPDPTAAAPPTASPGRGGGLLRLAPLAVLLAAVAAVWASGVTRYLSLAALSRNEAVLRAFVAHHGLAALGAFVGVYVLATALSLPGISMLTLTGGYLFGTWLGGAGTLLGATAGSLVAFLAIRSSLGVGLKARADRTGGRLKAIIEGMREGAFGYVLALRLIPFAPFWLVTAAAALADVAVAPYAAATFLGIMPLTVVYSAVGAGLGRVLRSGRTPSAAMLLEPRILAPLAALAVLSVATSLIQHRRTAAGRRARH